MDKKKFEHVCDAIDAFGGFSNYFRGRPSYFEFVGLWLNRDRRKYRAAEAVAFGAGIALGAIDPGMNYYRAVTDGEGEALLLKAQYDLRRQSRAAPN